MSTKEFCKVLASKSPTPGGGGASALVGAVGVALGSMVCNLTSGKKKYAEIEPALQRIMAEAEDLRNQLTGLINRDAEAFEPLSKAYAIPTDDPNKQTEMERCFKLACSVPMEIAKAAAKAIDLHLELAGYDTGFAVSDVGCGVVCCRAALEAAALNVYINTKYMSDRDYAKAAEDEMDALLDKYCPAADETYKTVLDKIRRK